MGWALPTWLAPLTNHKSRFARTREMDEYLQPNVDIRRFRMTPVCLKEKTIKTLTQDHQTDSHTSKLRVIIEV